MILNFDYLIINYTFLKLLSYAYNFLSISCDCTRWGREGAEIEYLPDSLVRGMLHQGCRSHKRRCREIEIFRDTGVSANGNLSVGQSSLINPCTFQQSILFINP